MDVFDHTDYSEAAFSGDGLCVTCGEERATRGVAFKDIPNETFLACQDRICLWGVVELAAERFSSRKPS